MNRTYLAVALCAALALGAEMAWGQCREVPPAGVTPQWRADLTEDQIKATRWGDDERFVTKAMRAEVAKRDGVTGAHDPSCGTPRAELDHDGPRCLGGQDSVSNLWFQGAPWWRLKDLVEDNACKEFREGKVTLRVARSYFENDWRVQFRAYCAKSVIPKQYCAELK